MAPPVQNESTCCKLFNRAVVTDRGHTRVTVVDYRDVEIVRNPFLVVTGTVFQRLYMLTETSFLLGIYCTVTIYIWRSTTVSFHKYVVANEGDLIAFTNSMATLAAFLLSFMTSLTMERWWRLRTEGIGSIWSASSQLTMFINQFVTKDLRVLSAIRRYARASLVVVFLKRRHGAANLRDNLRSLKTYGILEDDEVEKLAQYNNNLSESIWTWVNQIIVELNKQGLIQSSPLLIFLLERVSMGRAGAAVIGADLATPIPLPYMHLLALIVKMHNMILAVLMGMLSGSKFEQDHCLDACLAGARVMFLPFFYNGLLQIILELRDPFDGEINDFPMGKYERGMESDGRSYVEAISRLPNWLVRCEPVSVLSPRSGGGRRSAIRKTKSNWHMSSLV